MEYRVVFYEDEDGIKPLVEFLSQLELTNAILQEALLHGIAKLRNRNNHGMPFTRAIEGSIGILEMRVGKKDIARVFFFFRPGRQIVCTNGYVKKTQRLDPKELQRAERYKANWEQRFPNKGEIDD